MPWSSLLRIKLSFSGCLIIFTTESLQPLAHNDLNRTWSFPASTKSKLSLQRRSSFHESKMCWVSFSYCLSIAQVRKFFSSQQIEPSPLCNAKICFSSSSWEKEHKLAKMIVGIKAINNLTKYIILAMGKINKLGHNRQDTKRDPSSAR